MTKDTIVGIRIPFWFIQDQRWFIHPETLFIYFNFNKKTGWERSRKHHVRTVNVYTPTEDYLKTLKVVMDIDGSNENIFYYLKDTLKRETKSTDASELFNAYKAIFKGETDQMTIYPPTNWSLSVANKRKSIIALNGAYKRGIRPHFEKVYAEWYDSFKSYL